MSGLMMKYFVLKPHGTDIYAQASRQAMRRYAEEIESVNSELAQDLIAWVNVEELRKEKK